MSAKERRRRLLIRTERDAAQDRADRRDRSGIDEDLPTETLRVRGQAKAPVAIGDRAVSGNHYGLTTGGGQQQREREGNGQLRRVAHDQGDGGQARIGTPDPARQLSRSVAQPSTRKQARLRRTRTNKLTGQTNAQE